MSKPYSPALVALLRGVVYSHHERIWSEVVDYEVDIKKYFDDIYLELIIDKAEGYAYLKQKVSEDESVEFPRLVEKRRLNFYTSLLCLLLRQNLLENDSEGGNTKVVLTRNDIQEMVKPFAKETTNEANQMKQIDASIKKLCDEGFLRKMRAEEERYELNRIIKAFVNADVVKEGLEKMRLFAKSNEVEEE